jgi:hypothetical protein
MIVLEYKYSEASFVYNTSVAQMVRDVQMPITPSIVV